MTDSAGKPESGVQASDAIGEAIRRLDGAVAALENAVESRIERESELIDAEAEVQRMGADRSRLAEALDGAEAKAQRLEATNREVSRRLISAMEAIRTVLEREG